MLWILNEEWTFTNQNSIKFLEIFSHSWQTLSAFSKTEVTNHDVIMLVRVGTKRFQESSWKWMRFWGKIPLTGFQWPTRLWHLWVSWGSSAYHFMFNDCILDSPDHLQIDISIASTVTVDLSESLHNPRNILCETQLRISIKLWRNMKKQEWNHTQWTRRPWGCYVLSRALSRKLKAYSLRQEVKKIRVKNLNLEPQVEICKYIEQYIMLHDQQYSIILHLDNYYIVSLYI